MKIAVCPGSFDPVTFGHLDIIQRAARLFDRVVVLIMVNPNKTPTFTTEERKEMLEESLKDLGCNNVEIAFSDGLLADYARKIGATAIVKGLRAVSDYEYEFQMALTNKVLCEEVETVFLTTDSKYMYLSSSVVRQVARFGGDISPFVPAALLPRIRTRLQTE
ncbi:MAG: pantetheine-phosphate adenylyltransferase [Oscillospiraceae bacterium]|nr:pantetheine-phosphate adenylyltransferase [Oscillospiraceae bacterium]MBQ4101692.1 pantetheine-phosphate adenylyltransferase [Oscillospiraceae bacterium]